MKNFAIIAILFLTASASGETYSLASNNFPLYLYVLAYISLFRHITATQSSSSGLSSTSSNGPDGFEAPSYNAPSGQYLEDVQVNRSPTRRTRRPTRQPTRMPTGKADKQPTRRPTSRPTRRPTGSNNSSSFNDGLSRGRSEAERLWRNLGDDCANAFGFNDLVQQEIRRRNWHRSGNNFRQRAFNQGAREGMNEIVQKYEKKCLHDSPDLCIELGDTAADIIAFDHCRPNSGSSASSSQNFPRNCRDVGTNQCQGSMNDRVRRHCGSRANTSTLLSLQNSCRRQVNRLTRNNSNEELLEANVVESDAADVITEKKVLILGP